MGRLARLLREITPAWMMHTEQAQPEELGEVIRFRPKGRPPSTRDADKVWHDCIEKGLFGADTSDYTLEGEQSRTPDAPATGEGGSRATGKH